VPFQETPHARQGRGLRALDVHREEVHARGGGAEKVVEPCGLDLGGRAAVVRIVNATVLRVARVEVQPGAARSVGDRHTRQRDVPVPVGGDVLLHGGQVPGFRLEGENVPDSRLRATA
jgi:hypothetical protein